jgi:CHAD domain-containing protein
VAAKVVAVRTEEVFCRRGDVLAVDNIDALHDMRVATRRLRAALEVFGPCLARHSTARALHDIERLADALGARRDRDVQIQSLTQYAEARTATERAAVLAFVERLRMQQADANQVVAEALRQAEESDLHGRLERLARRAAERAGKRGKRHERRTGGAAAESAPR